MSKLYDRAEIYDLIDSEKRIEITRKDWKQFLGDRQIRTFLDVRWTYGIKDDIF